MKHLLLKKDEKIVFDEKTVTSIIFSDSGSVPTQFGGSHGASVSLTNKRIFVEVLSMKSLNKPLLDLSFSDIKHVDVKRFLFWKYLVVDTFISIPSEEIIKKTHGLMKATHRVWIQLGSDSQTWCDKIRLLRVEST